MPAHEHHDKKIKVNGIIIASYKTEVVLFDCEVFIPSMRVRVKDDIIDKVLGTSGRSEYTNVLFTVMGESIEVELYMKSRDEWYASAREIAKIELNDESPVLLNSLIKKYKTDNGLNTY